MQSPKFRAAGWRPVESLGNLRGEVSVADVVKRTDVRMIQLRDRPGLAFDACPELRVLGEFRRKQFDRDASVEARVARLPHFPHATGADRRDYRKKTSTNLPRLASSAARY